MEDLEKEIYGYFESAIKKDSYEKNQLSCFTQMLDRFAENLECKNKLCKLYKIYKSKQDYQEKLWPKVDFGLLINMIISIICGLLVNDISKNNLNLSNVIPAVLVAIFLLASPILGISLSIKFFSKYREIKNNKFLFFLEQYLLINNLI